MKVDYNWVKQQFADAKIRVGVGKAVLKMLKTWEEVDLDIEQAKQVLDILSTVGLGHALVVPKKDEIWVDARRGDLKVGDIVRVSHDAFNGSTGTLHNGRRGVIVGIRNGDIIVNSTDDTTPQIEGAHYQPEHLQKRVQ
jgi:hypothetical protein